MTRTSTKFTVSRAVYTYKRTSECRESYNMGVCVHVQKFMIVQTLQHTYSIAWTNYVHVHGVQQKLSLAQVHVHLQ